MAPIDEAKRLAARKKGMNEKQAEEEVIGDEGLKTLRGHRLFPGLETVEDTGMRQSLLMNAGQDAVFTPETRQMRRNAGRKEPGGKDIELPAPSKRKGR